MNKPEFFVTPGYGERQLRLFHYSQAVKIGSRLELSGQGGWNDNWEFPESITDEIAQAFRNVERTLDVAGACWEHVIHVNSYHVGLDGRQEEINQAMTEHSATTCQTTPPSGLAWEWRPSEARRCGSRSALPPFSRNEGKEPDCWFAPMLRM